MKSEAGGLRLGRGRLRFGREEWAGSFGDLGTALPLLIGVIGATGVDAAGVFVVFGLAQLGSGLMYGLPLPMQPLKAMAALAISQRLAPGVLFGGGLAIGLMMMGLSVSGALGWLARGIPQVVVRGLQGGLGVTLCWLALGTYVPSEGAVGYGLAGAAGLMVWGLRGQRRFPAALGVVLLGAVYGGLYRLDAGRLVEGWGWALPKVRWPEGGAVWAGLVVLALPQLPLSLANSVIATQRTVQDLFPGRGVGVGRLGMTYGIFNVVASCLGGVPVCHGCGGLVGHYALGGRSGGSVVIYGMLFLALGLGGSVAAGEWVQLFPKPILGVLLGLEGLALLGLLRDVWGSARSMGVAAVVGGCAVFLPQGYLIGMALGVLLWRVLGGRNLHSTGGGAGFL